MCPFHGCSSQSSRDMERIFGNRYVLCIDFHSISIFIFVLFILSEANCPINIDSKSYETTKKNMEIKPHSRYIFDEAAGHVYLLMKNDSYPRYLRSEMYKEYLSGTKKKVSYSLLKLAIYK